MINKSWIISLILCVSIVCATAFSAKAQQLSITVEGVKDTVCYLTVYKDKNKYIKDTLRVNSSGLATCDVKPLAPGIYVIYFPSLEYRSIEVVITGEEHIL